jgi:formyl-CoA transferase
LRIANRQAVNDLVGAAVAGRQRHDVLSALRDAGIPSSPVNTVAEYVSDPSLVAAGVLEKIDIPGVPEMALAGALFGAEFLPGNRRPPPRAGEHTGEVLQSLGYSAADIQVLRDAGAVR